MSQGLNHLTAVVLLMWALSSMVFAQSSIHYDFEDGRMHGNPTSMRVPPRIVTEAGNSFLRITGSASDKEDIPRYHHARNRSTIRMLSSPNAMPAITAANMRQTYSARFRFHENAGNDGTVFELFQYDQSGCNYAEVDGCGPVVIFGRQGTTLWGRANYAGESKHTNFSNTTARAGSWYQIKVVAVWSDSAGTGRIDAYVNGRQVGHVTGRGTNLHHTSNRLPDLKVGMYGNHAVGTLDVDNIQVGGGGSHEDDPPPPAEPTPATPPAERPTPLPPPRNFRVVLR